MLDRLENVNAPDLVLTDFLLEQFSLNEAVDYLNFRMEMSDYLGPEVFAENKVESWWRQSQGQLLSLHEYAQEKLLASVSTAQAHKRNKSSQLIPHVVAVSVLASGFFLGYLYLGNNSSLKDVSPATAALSVTKAAPQVTIPSQSASASSGSAANYLEVSAGYKSTELLNESEVAIPAQVAIETNPDKPRVASVIKQSVVPLIKTNAIDNHPLQKLAQASSQNSSNELKKIAVTSDSSRASVQAKSKDGMPTLARQTSGFSNQEKAILSWDVSEFTLQLVGLSSEKSARDFIAAQVNKKDLLLFRSLRQSKDWFVVVIGRFPTSAKARQAAQDLPAAQRQASPWPREVKVIQQEIMQRN